LLKKTTEKRRYMRPILKFLEEPLIEKIIDEAIEILCKIGVEINNTKILSMLQNHNTKVDMGKKHVYLNREIIERAIKTVPGSFKLYDVLGNETHDLSGYNVYFTPGSAALNILDYQTGKIRKPTTEDYIQYTKVIGQLDNIASQSTAFIPADVHEKISDSYRLYLSLLFCEKPVVTGAFTIQGFTLMKDLLLAVRGTKEDLKEKPLAVFSCCPTSPMKWSDVTSQNVVDCARYSIPVEFISMPLSGFMAPVTLVGTLIQHTAETLSGIVISQLTNPGTPILYGGSPAIFDVRFETTPMGAVETQMLDCAYSEIGRFLGIPTQGYISLSDSKRLDSQAGMESSMGATLAALSGINNISGPGMLDFESCQSLEKLILDNEICGMVLHMLKGIEPKEDFPSLPHFEELIGEKHLLISHHTRKYLRDEFYFPGPVIDRATRTRWQEEGSRTLYERAHSEVEKLVKKYTLSRLPDDRKSNVIKRMEDEARRLRMKDFPPFPLLFDA
jgi:trimethylamine--corrinoid protein Co-methyltransferase